MVPVDIVEISEALGGLTSAIGGEIVWKIVASIMVVVVGLISLSIFKGMLGGLVQARVIDKSSKDTIYRITKAAIYIMVFLTILYLFTGSSFVMAIILVGFFGVIIASWDVIANLVSYYIIIGMRVVGQGDYVVLPNGIHGKVRDVKPLHVVVEGAHGVYQVPNMLVIREGILRRAETFAYRIIVRVWGLQETAHIENVKEIVKNVVQMKAKELMDAASKPQILIDEISDDSVTIKIVVHVPGPRPKPERLSGVIVELAKRLRDSGYSHTITFETPEGYGQRWRAVE